MCSPQYFSPKRCWWSHPHVRLSSLLTGECGGPDFGASWCKFLSAGSFLMEWTVIINTNCSDKYDKLPLTHNVPGALPLCKQNRSVCINLSAPLNWKGGEALSSICFSSPPLNIVSFPRVQPLNTREDTTAKFISPSVSHRTPLTGRHGRPG